jgi:uncharacterized membrane protein YdbT with pleckstrin-like domain
MFGGPEPRIRAALVEGEERLHTSRPDRVAWVFDQSLHVLAVAVCAFVAWQAGSTALAWVAVLAALGLFAYLAGAFWSVSWTRYVLTSHRVMRFSGVLRHDQEYMSWSKITDVSIERSLADRLTATATIRIHSANENSSFKALSDVYRPLELAARITEQVNERAGAPPRRS